MRTYPLRTKSGEIYAFEVDNTLLSAARIGRIVRESLGAQVTSGPNTFFARTDVRLTFKLKEKSFQVWEPYGDNSRYWIGPDNAESDRLPEIDIIREAIEKARISPFHRLLTLWRRRRAA